jgi:hypothetical protein
MDPLKLPNAVASRMAMATVRRRATTARDYRGAGDFISRASLGHITEAHVAKMSKRRGTDRERGDHALQERAKETLQTLRDATIIRAGQERRDVVTKSASNMNVPPGRVVRGRDIDVPPAHQMVECLFHSLSDRDDDGWILYVSDGDVDRVEDEHARVRASTAPSVRSTHPQRSDLKVTVQAT